MWIAILQGKLIDSINLGIADNPKGIYLKDFLIIEIVLLIRFKKKLLL